MNHSKEQLIDALMGEYAVLIQDDIDGELEDTEEEYHAYLKGLTVEQLVLETACDDVELTLDDFVYAYS